jgi:hypothetical protein
MRPELPLSVPEEIVDDSPDRAIVVRLRERYAEARELVSLEPAWEPSHAHLEWILGPRRNRELDFVPLGREISELVVLWLEDLALELEAEPGAGPEWDAGTRQSVAQTLRSATRDFAGTLLGAGPRPAAES